VLELENVSKKWSAAFSHHGINLAVGDGEFFVLLGPSGAGKSLLLELIAGFHSPDAGRIRIRGRDVTSLPPEKRNVGLVFQDQALFPHMTVRENIAYGLKGRVAGREAAAERTDRAAAMLRIEALLDRPSDLLSAGQRQRVALARALAIQPDLLLLDEPFSSLDPPLRQDLWREMKALHEKTGVTILHVTHDRGEAAVLGRRVAIIRNGRIEQVGADWSVFDEPVNQFVAEFTGGRNIYAGEARVAGEDCEFTSGSLTIVCVHNLHGLCKALIRPENIILSREPIHTSARNQFHCVVESLLSLGDVCEVTGRFGEHRMTSVVTARSVQDLLIAPGTPLYFSFKASSVHLFRDTTPPE